MDFKDFILIILLSIPACGALVSGLLMLRLAKKGESPLGRKPLMLLTLSFCASFFTWISITFYLQLPETHAFLKLIGITASMLICVFAYHFVFEVTRIKEVGKFPKWHYLFSVLGLALFIWLKFPVFLPIIIFNAIYSILCLYRVFQYRRAVVNYSADEQRGSIRWIYHLVYIMLAMIPVMFGAFALSGEVQLTMLILLMLIAVFKYAILTHNVLLENFVLIQLSKKEEEDIKQEYNRGDARHLESYMRRKKPYLNPKLKITDMTADLGTNRTTLSSFINRNYGMNFCRYINRFRLEELEKLKTDPRNSKLDEIDLILMAGFSDWRGYQRVKKRENCKIDT